MLLIQVLQEIEAQMGLAVDKILVEDKWERPELQREPSVLRVRLTSVAGGGRAGGWEGAAQEGWFRLRVLAPQHLLGQAHLLREQAG